MHFSADKGAEVGEDGETPVTEDYGIEAPYRFTGKIEKMTVEIKSITASDKVMADLAAAECNLKRGISD